MTRQQLAEYVRRNQIAINPARQTNHALLRWEKHFADLFQGNLTSMVKHAADNIASIPLPYNEPNKDKEIHDLATINKLKQLRDDFVTGIEKIQQEYSTQSKDSTKALDEEKSSLVARQGSSPVAQQDLIRAAHVLANEHLTQVRVRRVSINAPLKDITNRLSDKGFIHPKINRPMANLELSLLNDADIIAAYSLLMYGLLS